MKISVTDKHRSGIMSEFARAIGATTEGRFFRIPEDKGEGYITGFSWEDNELRMMVRNYYLNEELLIERTNEPAAGQDDIIFMMSGIFPSPVTSEKQPSSEQPSVFICMQAVSSVLTMPSNTFFRSIGIAVSRQHLRKLFGNIPHPVVLTILEGKENFAFETAISPEMISVASEIEHLKVPESLESHYCKLKCEELLCHIVALLTQREAMPAGGMHINDIKAIYAIKLHLQSHLDTPSNIAGLAADAGMSEPKLRKLFKQTFGKGVFEYYQGMRMQEAAQLLKDKRLTVSEVGYQMGFTNLSHFSRVFEQHIGMKPKKYSGL
ncbi:helix-turn-helix transcriptional regulator [Flavobacterium zepuense]|uniref:Helix-turn-helix transcriptional regulator n=1 Tax=Flavobacterium zepuense TaxID=2593302 RepID=A0A552V7K4_9FLAO|nr:AraC family transcriptional regulator [Flavobacterium zepuense]TRW26451.1 helix-turn-helix transcriptional regulator [Flavobacterium zepuense]